MDFSSKSSTNYFYRYYRNNIYAFIRKIKDNWNYGFLAKLDRFAKADPEQTLFVLEKYLLDRVFGATSEKKWFHLDDEKIAVFKDLYKSNPAETKALINKLLEKVGRTFWPFKDIIED